jgi:hypothetical protein
MFVKSRDGKHSWFVRLVALVALLADLYLVVHFRGRISDDTFLYLLLWGFWLVVVPYWWFAIAEEKFYRLESGLAELDDGRIPGLLNATSSIRASITTLIAIIMAIAPGLQWALLRLRMR